MPKSANAHVMTTILNAMPSNGVLTTVTIQQNVPFPTMSIHNVLTDNLITNNAKEITNGLVVIPVIQTHARQVKSSKRIQDVAFTILLLGLVASRQAVRVIHL